MASQNLADCDPKLTQPPTQMSATRISRRFSRGSSSQNGSQSWRSSRVEKPRSNHQSPRTGDRRRTTTPSSKRYTTLDDHYNMMFGYSSQDQTEDHTTQPRTYPRPVSWHPGSSCSTAQHQYSTNGQFDWSHDQRSSTKDSSVPLPSGVSHFEDFSSNLTPAVDSYTNSPSWQDVPSERTSGHRLSGYSALDGQPTPWSVPDWVQMTQARSRAQSPMSPDLLPIQAPPEMEEDEEDEEFEEEGKELVGMGLYDPPEGYNSWFASGSREGTGKGLKLEETWEPPPEEEDDSDSDANEEESDEKVDNMDTAQDDASSDDASVDEPPAPIPAAATTLAKPISTIHQGQSFPVNMSGQSFFFEEDEGLQSEWWHQHLRPSTIPTTTVGYGWI